VPKAVRLIWGGIKNLLSGVTAVAHHNPFYPIFDAAFPVRVVRDCGWAHSLAFEPRLLEIFRNRAHGRPFLIHAAEGVDDSARGEIRQLDEAGILTPDTVLIHALGLGPGDLRLIADRGCSILCCPNSNISTYGRTLDLPAVLSAGIPVALGTDSAVTSVGDLRDDIRLAVSLGVPVERVYGMVTSEAAAILKQSAVNDLIAVRDEGQTPAESLLKLTPELVVVDGRIKLISERLAVGCPPPLIRGFQRICVASHSVGLIDAGVKQLLAEVESRIGAPCSLAGRPVTA